MNKAQVMNDLEDIFRSLFGREDIRLSEDMRVGDIEGWDSFRQIEVILAVEQRYGIKASARETEQLSSIDALAILVLRKVGAAS